MYAVGKRCILIFVYFIHEAQVFVNDISYEMETERYYC